VFITAGPSTKLFTWGGGGDMGGHVLRETTSRGLCGLVCPPRKSCPLCVSGWCVCLLLQDRVCLLQDLVQRCLHGGGGGYGRTCATRDDEPRPVWTSLPMCVCLLLQDLVQRCLHGGGGDMGGHVLRETTSRGLCGLVCPSRTSERGGTAHRVYYCVKRETIFCNTKFRENASITSMIIS
jgi:hypothetical protein